jgi:esterase/lipase
MKNSNRWTIKYDKCIVCGRTDRTHNGKGYCATCSTAKRRRENPGSYKTYLKTPQQIAAIKKYQKEYHKKYQKEYREKNSEKVKAYQKAYRDKKRAEKAEQLNG